MDELDVDLVQAQLAQARSIVDPSERLVVLSIVAAGVVTALLAEVERLRADNERLEAQAARLARELTASRDAGRGYW